MERVLVTGASGYIGKALLENSRDMNITSLDRVFNDEVVQRSEDFINADLNDLTELQKNVLFSFEGVVVNLAAARSDDQFEAVYKRDNIQATDSLLKNLDPNKIRKFIHIGSVAAIDGERLEQHEIVPSTSDDWYRLTKFKQQLMISTWASKFRIPLVILAPSAVYDNNAIANSTNIGRLEKVISITKVAPRIDVIKSLTPMHLLIDAIGLSIFDSKSPEIERYLVVERPSTTVTKICQQKFKSKMIIPTPFLKSFLLLLAFLLLVFRLNHKFPLTRERINKLYRPTNYQPGTKYKDWYNEKH